jgi:hypothetical protein
MPIRLSDTQKITNVPNSRDIGALINLDNSIGPDANQPIPPLPRIQSGLRTKNDTYELIDAIDYSSSSSIFTTTNVNFPLTGLYSRYKLVFEKLIFTSAPVIYLSFDNTGSNTYYYEYGAYNGGSNSVSSTWTTNSTGIIIGNTTAFPAFSVTGIFGDIDIYTPGFSLDTVGGGSNGGIEAFWRLHSEANRVSGHGAILTASNALRAIGLQMTYSPSAGKISFYGLPRN